jgi:hypothetical protein
MPSYGGSSINAIDILLRFVLDKKAYDEVRSGITSVGQAVGAVGMDNNALGITALKLQPVLEQQEKEAGRLQLAWWRTQRELRAAQFLFTAIAGVGTGIMAPFLLATKTWADSMDKVGATNDRVFNAYKKDMDIIKAAQLSVGRTTAAVLLPALDAAAKLATKAAAFVEAHPDILKAALTTGAVLVAIATVGTLITQGVKFYVDIKFVTASAMNIAAGNLMVFAAKQNLLAAAAMMRGGVPGMAQDLALATPTWQQGLFGTTGISGVLSKLVGVLGPIAVTLAALAAGGWLGYKLTNEAGLGKMVDKNYKEQTPDDIWKTFRNLIATDLGGLILLEEKLGVSAVYGSKVWDVIKGLLGLGDASTKTADDLQSAADALAQAQKDAEGTKILAKLDTDNKKAALKLAKDQEQAVKDMNKAIATAENNYGNALIKSALDLSRRVAKIKEDAAFTELKATQDHNLAIQQDAEKAKDDLLQIEKDRLDKLKQLEIDHKEKVYELLGARDALGLVQERRKYLQDVADANRGSDDQKNQRRKDLNDQIRYNNQKFQLDEQQRKMDLAKAIQDAEVERAQRDADAKAALDAEIEQAHIAEDEKLQDLQAAYAEERKQRVLAAYEDIIALGGALETERKFKKQYYDLMLSDAESFAIAYRAALSKIAGTTGTADLHPILRQSGGYAYGGVYRMGEGGYEWVASHASTIAAERAVGHRLTQSDFTSLFTGGLGGKQITLYDHRTFDSRLSPEDKFQIERETSEMLIGVMTK